MNRHAACGLSKESHCPGHNQMQQYSFESILTPILQNMEIPTLKDFQHDPAYTEETPVTMVINEKQIEAVDMSGVAITNGIIDLLFEKVCGG